MFRTHLVSLLAFLALLFSAACEPQLLPQIEPTQPQKNPTALPSPAISATFTPLPTRAATLPPSAIPADDPSGLEPFTMQFMDVSELYISPTGSDDNDGASREKPLQTIGAAWARIPPGELSSGYRLNLLPGVYPCEGDCINYFSGRHGSYAQPIILQAADGPGTVTLLGGLNLFDVSHFYLLDLTLWAGAEAGAAFGNNVLHIEQADHMLLRGLSLRGPAACLNDTCNDIQEVLKINQSQFIYLENSELSGTYQTVLDFFSVQYGHILNNHIHHSGGRCAYLKGGSAYFWIANNELNDCREAGFQAGEGSNLAFMRPPWLQYEAYNLKVVNNVLHDIYGAGLSVSGGYNILMAYNTLYRIGLEDESGRPWGLLQAVLGARGCVAADEFGGENGTQQRCRQQLDLGGWGTDQIGYDQGGEWIPNRNVYILNNIFYNPAGSATRYVQFVINGPVMPPETTRNLPSPAVTDQNLVIRGNLIWNSPLEGPELVGDNNGSGNIGCLPENPSCNPAQLSAQNTINAFEPQLVDPAGGDFRPQPGGNLFGLPAVEMPDFLWEDAGGAPAWTLSNRLPLDRNNAARSAGGVIGAYDTTP